MTGDLIPAALRVAAVFEKLEIVYWLETSPVPATNAGIRR